MGWCPRQDSNLYPCLSQKHALSFELRGHSHEMALDLKRSSAILVLRNPIGSVIAFLPIFFKLPVVGLLAKYNSPLAVELGRSYTPQQQFHTANTQDIPSA